MTVNLSPGVLGMGVLILIASLLLTNALTYVLTEARFMPVLEKIQTDIEDIEQLKRGTGPTD